MKAFYIKTKIIETNSPSVNFEELINNTSDDLVPYTAEMDLRLESVDIPDHLADRFREQFVNGPPTEEQLMNFLKQDEQH